MADTGNRDTDPDGLAAFGAEERKKSSGSLKAVRVPPRPDSVLDPDPVLQARGVNGRYRGITPSDSDRPVPDPPTIPELPKELEEKHPRMDRAPREKTWDAVPPELVANSPGLRTIETYARDGSKRSQQSRTETRELRTEFHEFKANNAQEHLGINEKQVETNNRLNDVQKQLPSTLRSTRVWNTIGGVMVVAAAYLAYLTAHEQRLSDQARAAAAQAAPAQAAHR